MDRIPGFGELSFFRKERNLRKKETTIGKERNLNYSRKERNYTSLKVKLQLWEKPVDRGSNPRRPIFLRWQR